MVVEEQRPLYQVKIVIDTNIVFSAILNPEGKLNDLLLNSSENYDFFSPTFIQSEISRKHAKLRKLSSLKSSEISFLKAMIFKNLTLIDSDLVRPTSWEKAFQLTHDVDEKDTPFIALAIDLNAIVLTGDKKLIKGITSKGFTRFTTVENLLRERD